MLAILGSYQESGILVLSTRDEASIEPSQCRVQTLFTWSVWLQTLSTGHAPESLEDPARLCLCENHHSPGCTQSFRKPLLNQISYIPAIILFSLCIFWTGDLSSCTDFHLRVRMARLSLHLLHTISSTASLRLCQPLIRLSPILVEGCIRLMRTASLRTYTLPS